MKSMAKWVGALVLSFCSLSYSNAQIVTLPIPGAPGLNVTVGTGINALPLQDIRSNPNAVNITTWDDHYTNVPLGFTFPMFGQNFTNSWAATNGFVTFQDPQVSGLYGGCCSGVDLRSTTDPRYNYTIYGMHTDLYSWNGANQYYLRGNNEMTYGWYDLSQCCSSQGGNSFEIKINSSGLIDTRIAGAMVSWNPVTSGFSGNLANGEYFQHYHGQGLNITPGSASIFSWQALGGTGQGVDQCTINPLYNPSCPGYAAAYLTQQCTISPIYNPSCPGYQQAYFTQQCTANQLYDTNCPGYAQAYLEYQCSANPLYSTTCAGYEQAYLNQQCSINQLYSSSCSGYRTALNQCTTNPLGNVLCPGYSTATNVCSNNQLTYSYCPSYTTTLAACSTNPQSNTLCPGYNPNPQTSTASNSTATSPISTTRSTTETTVGISSDGKVEATVSATGDSNVDKTISSTITTTNTAAAPAAPVQLTQPSGGGGNSGPAPVTAAVASEKKQEKQEDKKDASNTNAGPSQTTATASTSDKKADQPKTARQELQERREAAAKAKAVEDGKNLAGSMGKVADMEQQKMVQNVVLQAMAFVPGFDVYNKAMIPDGVGYKPYSIYGGQKVIENRATLRMFGGTDKLHNEMVESQYSLGTYGK
jgi:hypothetical protein